MVRLWGNSIISFIFIYWDNAFEEEIEGGEYRYNYRQFNNNFMGSFWTGSFS